MSIENMEFPFNLGIMLGLLCRTETVKSLKEKGASEEDIRALYAAAIKIANCFYSRPAQAGVMIPEE